MSTRKLVLIAFLLTLIGASVALANIVRPRLAGPNVLYLPVVAKDPTASPSPSPSGSASPAPSGSASPSPSGSPEPSAPPPSFNNCQEDPYADDAPNFPVQILSVDKIAETVTLKNTSTSAVDLSGWRMCSVRGNQLHATLSGTLAGGATLVVPSQAGGNIWSNSEDDDGALYNNNGSLVSYWDD